MDEQPSLIEAPALPTIRSQMSWEDWCTLQELPASVNPILSFRTGMLGMACMGMGFEEKDA